MTEVTIFQALAFDFVDGDLVSGTPVDCESPTRAIQTAQGQWKVLGHAGAVAFSRTSDFGTRTTAASIYCAGSAKCRMNI
jgi:hypothetical protein